MLANVFINLYFNCYIQMECREENLTGKWRKQVVAALINWSAFTRNAKSCAHFVNNYFICRLKFSFGFKLQNKNKPDSIFQRKLAPKVSCGSIRCASIWSKLLGNHMNTIPLLMFLIIIFLHENNQFPVPAF